MARAAQLRQMRLEAARAKGTHTKAEWSALASLFEACVCCGVPNVELNGGAATKDHIVPIVAGGCDCIANLQPLCRQCNSAGTGHTDYRNAARPGWAVDFVERLQSL